MSKTNEPAGKAGLEIERKWMVQNWPKADFPLLAEEEMRQGYVTVEPTVRIREEKNRLTGEDLFILCFKSGRGLTRKEIEFPIEEARFHDLEDLIGFPLIPKLRRTYQLPGGLHLEVSRVDAGAPTEFWYAEIEFSSEAEARAYNPGDDGLGDYLTDDVTGTPGSSMGAYWCETRLGTPSELS
jgi:adenylate cyclase